MATDGAQPWRVAAPTHTVSLPFEVDANTAEATFENGLGLIALLKAERAKPQKTDITAGRGQQEAIGAGSSS